MDELLEFEIPTFYASAIINADNSGLSDEDDEELDDFINEIVETYGNANFMLGDKSDESYFSSSNDVNNLGSDVTILYLQPTKEYSFGGGVAVGGIVGAYLGYKAGRMRPQKAGFETEKKIGRRIKKEGQKIAGDITISKKKPQTMAKGGNIKPKYKLGDSVIVDYGNNTKGEITIKDSFNPNWSNGFVYTSYEKGDSMIFTEDMISERDGFNEVWGRFKDGIRKDFGGDKYAEGGDISYGGYTPFPLKADEIKVVDMFTQNPITKETDVKGKDVLTHTLVETENGYNWRINDPKTNENLIHIHYPFHLRQKAVKEFKNAYSINRYAEGGKTYSEKQEELEENIKNISEKEKRETFKKAFGYEYDGEFNEKGEKIRQHPLPLDIAYKVALYSLERRKNDSMEQGGNISYEVGVPKEMIEKEIQQLQMDRTNALTDLERFRIDKKIRQNKEILKHRSSYEKGGNISYDLSDVI
tara:strand:- start:10504 stop:11919 length:1416 start_codon:yes stop_codon:yes gene_type:complete